jgi:hypothetical protein
VERQEECLDCLSSELLISELKHFERIFEKEVH